MAQSHSTLELTLAGIAHRCARETERFFRRVDFDPSFCYELFRRALLERNQEACELLFKQYQPLVAGWVERHGSFHATTEEVQYFVNRAFEKLWLALTPEKFSRFPDLKSLLSYLKMCVHSAIVDHARGERNFYADQEPPPTIGDSPADRSRVEEQTLDHVDNEAFWHAISVRLRDEKEELVVYGSFVLAMKPRELQTQYSDTFPDVTQIYRIKQNVLDRLRRDQELQDFLRQLA